MNNKTKISIFFVILLLLISLASAGFYFISYENEKSARSELQKQFNLVKEQKDRLQMQLDEINNQKLSLESKLKKNELLISDLNEKLTKETQEKKILMEEQESLKAKITEIQQEKETIQDALNDKLKELTQLKIQLDSAISQKEQLERTKQSAPLKTKREDLEKIIVAPQVPAEEIEEEITAEVIKEPEQEVKAEVSDEVKQEIIEPKSVLSGKVILVNREYEFIVLNIGKSNGVELEDLFEIFHGDISIGNAKIEKVRDTISAANLLEGFKKDKISEGDIANKID